MTATNDIQPALQLISLFTGAGGLDLGFEAAGCTTRVAVEMDAEAVKTLRLNRDWPVIEGDIHGVPSEKILATAGLEEGEADLLVGGPPCQPFSKAGYWAAGDSLRLEDPRAGTLAAYCRVLRDTLPRAFLLENVPGLAFRQKSEGLDLIRRTVDGINRERGVDYSFSVAKLNAADFGVPQLRERVFVIGCRSGTDFAFPEATHGEDSGLSPRTTAWDALGDLEDDDDPALRMGGKWSDLLVSIPEGRNYLHHTERGEGLRLFGWRRRYWSFLLKLAKDRPSWTLQAQPGPAIGPFHWKSRRLSARELARLQTFPDDFTLAGPLRSAQRQAGNAVPSALAEVLARHIRRQLFGHSIATAPSLIPSRRIPVPAAEPVAPVHSKFLSLVGRHAAHPGTGQGDGARRRDAVGSPDQGRRRNTAVRGMPLKS